MEVRLLNANELNWAASTAMEVYTVCFLPYAQTPEEIERFKQYVNEDHLWVELCKKKLYLWGAFEQGQMCGVSAMEHTGRVTMLYVKQAYQLGSCELELMRAMRAYAVTVLGLAESAVQVHLLHPGYSQQAAPQPSYGQNQVYGQRVYGQNQAYGQRVYGQNQAYGQAGKWNTNATVWNTGRKRGVVIAFAAVFVSIAVVAVTALIYMKRTPHMVVAEQNEKPWEVSGNLESLNPEADDIWNTLWDTQAPEAVTEVETVNGYAPLPDGLGADVIVPLEDIYIAENLEYTVSEAKIEVADDDAKGVTEFEVNYPQITYADGRDASAVNQILRDCACLWMDAMYPEPEPDMVSLSAYDEDYPYLASYVDYEITYMSNDLLCVAYEDHYFGGSIYLEYGDLRTRMIQLSTGNCYNIEDIITHDGAFDKGYYEKLCVENEKFGTAPAFDYENAGETLDGGISDGRYFSNFVISNSGMKINLTYHYGDGSLLMRGWVSTDYSEEELADYRTESEFWQLYAGE